MTDNFSLSPQVQVVSPDECGAVSDFLQSVFHPPADALLIQRPVLTWKYFQFRPDCAWPTGRSFVYRSDEEIAAHCAIWPLTLVSGEERIPAMHLIDWAASSTHPGAGVMLYTTLAKQSPCAIVIGGATQARRILTRIGFQQSGEWNVYRRVLRPWRYFRSRPGSGGTLGKRLLRLLRDIAYCFHRGRRQRAEGWSAEPVARFEPDSAALPSSQSDHWLRFERTADFLNYILDCPGMPWRAFVLRRSGEVQGYALVNFVYGEARIVDLWVHKRSEEAWRGAVLLTAAAAAKTFDADQLLISAASPFLCQILRELGFLPYSSKPVFLADRDKQLRPDPEDLHLSFLDSDAFLLP